MHVSAKPQYAYILAVVVGVVAAVLVSLLMSKAPMLQPLVIAFVVYGAFGALFGFLWPVGSWRWGIWINIPIWFLIGLSVMFAGYFYMFLTKDFPVLMVELLSACIGAYVGARLALRQKKTKA